VSSEVMERMVITIWMPQNGKAENLRCLNYFEGHFARKWCTIILTHQCGDLIKGCFKVI